MSQHSETSIAQQKGASSSDGLPTPATVQQLLDLNRDFYAAISPHFDQTRGSIAEGMVQALDFLYPKEDRAKSQGPSEEAGSSSGPWPSTLGPALLRVLDAGCGNGRFARALAEAGIAVDYVGLDADAGLLESARRHHCNLPGVDATFLTADLAGEFPPLPFDKFDLVVSLAVLHHMPGRALRQTVVNRLARALADDGALLLSTWQFMESERLAARVQPWESIGLTAADVEPGDALLPWDQGVHALRYVHLIDEAEINELAAGAGLQVIHTFRADGKSGNLSLYAILRPQIGS